MHESGGPSPHIISTAYKAVALYYEGADSLEYIRRDAPSVYRRVDESLTLIFDMVNRDELVGFQLKGFRSLYLQEVAPLGDFPSLVGILERLFTAVGHGVLARKEAYDRARKLALEDRVEVHDLPKAS